MKLATPGRIENLAAQSASYQKMEGFTLTEPRLQMIHSRLNALLRIVQLESDGNPVDIDGFRIKDPQKWATSRVGPPFTELWHISTACNIRCPFCYEEGDPEGGSVLNEPVEMATLSEIETRLKYRDSLNGTGLFQPLTFMNEIFCNPQAMEIMERLRAANPDGVFTFVTNGTYLTEDIVARIAELKPVFFNYSVNSLDATVRRRFFRDLQPEIAIGALELLQKYRIPYLGSLVCWPSIPWEDVKNTVRELDKGNCAIIRFSLSAYSKYLKGRHFQREGFWAKGLAVAQEMMAEVDTPIKIEPYHYMDPTCLPHVAGTIKGAPAWRAGLRIGDLLHEVNGRQVPTANHALSALAQAAHDGSSVRISYIPKGGGDLFDIYLDDRNGPFGYPYDDMLGFAGFEWGLILIDNLKFSYLQEMREIIARHKAKRILLCSSKLMKPIVAKMIQVSGAFNDVEILLEVPKNEYFGGSVILGDLLVVEDYINFINDCKVANRTPIDLVLIPSSPFSLGGWLRDLRAVPFTEIERRVGIKVELVHCKPING